MKIFSFFRRKTDVEWDNFAEFEGTIADSFHWISLDSTTQFMEWDQSYDQVEVKSEVESNLREGQSKTA